MNSNLSQQKTSDNAITNITSISANADGPRDAASCSIDHIMLEIKLDTEGNHQAGLSFKPQGIHEVLATQDCTMCATASLNSATNPAACRPNRESVHCEPPQSLPAAYVNVSVDRLRRRRRRNTSPISDSLSEISAAARPLHASIPVLFSYISRYTSCLISCHLLVHLTLVLCTSVPLGQIEKFHLFLDI